MTDFIIKKLPYDLTDNAGLARVRLNAVVRQPTGLHPRLYIFLLVGLHVPE